MPGRHSRRDPAARGEPAVAQPEVYDLLPAPTREPARGRHTAQPRRVVEERPAAPAADLTDYPIQVGSVAAEQVRYARAGRTILDGVSLRVDAGRSLAVVGPSGTGKSTLLALLGGLEPPDSGRVTREPAGARIGMILQNYGLVGLLTAAENVEVPLQSGRYGRLTRRQIRARAVAALETVGLVAAAGQLIEELSGGQQQRVAIARALAMQPSVVLADEFSAELDHRNKEHALELMLGVARRGGIVIVATHDPEIARSCDAVLELG